MYHYVPIFEYTSHVLVYIHMLNIHCISFIYTKKTEYLVVTNELHSTVCKINSYIRYSSIQSLLYTSHCQVLLITITMMLFDMDLV